MEFELDDDQLALQEAAREVVAKECSAAYVRSVIDDGVDPATWWSTMVDLDWPALAIDEPFGGIGSSWIELGIVLEELGRASDPSPYLATVSQFVPAIDNCGDPDQRTHWLSQVAAGSVTGALALGQGSVKASAVDAGWRLEGTAPDVIDGDRADEVAVVADGPDGIAVFVVNRVENADTLTVAPVPAFDHTTRVAGLTFEGVVVPADRRLTGTAVAAGVGRAVGEATLGWAITTVGACQRILDLVIAYVTERHQFGVPIGSFQAVKHKAVDMYIAIERARAVAQYASLIVAEDADGRSTAISMAKAAAGDSQQIVFQHGLQLFGGIGFTWENDLQLALRRAKIGAVMFGGTSEHRRRIAQEALTQEAQTQEAQTP